MPALSIIIPIFNCENSIEKCLDSILQQNFNDYEILLIDDGSNDNSLKICKAFAAHDKRIIAYHQNNKGVSAARNYGLSIAKGKYVTFIDADDQIDRGMLITLYSAIHNYEAQLVIAGCTNIYIRKKNIKKNYIIPDKFVAKGKKEIKNHISILYDKFLIFSPCFKFYSMDIIKKYYIHFNNDVHIGEDAIFNFEYITYVNKIVSIDKSFYNYIHHNNSSTKKFYATRLSDALLLYEKSLYLANFFNIDLTLTAKKKLLRSILCCTNSIIFDKKIQLSAKKKELKNIVTSKKIYEIVKEKNFFNLELILCKVIFTLKSWKILVILSLLFKLAKKILNKE